MDFSVKADMKTSPQPPHGEGWDVARYLIAYDLALRLEGHHNRPQLQPSEAKQVYDLMLVLAQQMQEPTS